MGLFSTSDTTPNRSSGKPNKQASSAAVAEMDGLKNGQQPKTGWTKKLSDRAGILAGQKPPTRVASPGTTVRMVGEKLGAVNLHDNSHRIGDIPPLPGSRKGKERVAGFTDSPAPSIRGSPYDGSLSSSRSTIRLTTQPVQQSPASRPASILSRSSHVSYTPSEASNHTLTRETVAAIDAVSRRYSATSDSVYGYDNETDRGSVYSQEEMRPASPAPPVPRLPEMHFSQELRTVSSLGAPERPLSITSSRPSTSTSSRRGPWSALAGTLDTNLPRTFPSNYPRDDYYGNYDSPEGAISPSFFLESEFSRTLDNRTINMDYSPAASSFAAPTNSPVGGSEAGYKHWHHNPIGNNNSMLFIRDQLRGSIPRDDETCGSEAGETYKGYRYERPGSVMTSISRRGPTKAYHTPGGYDGNDKKVSGIITSNAHSSTNIDDRVPDLPSLPPLPPSPHPQDAHRRESSGSSAITSLESPSSYRTPHSRVSSRTTPSPPGRQKNVAPTVAPLEVRKNGIRQLMLPAALLAGNRPSDVNLERDSDYHTSSARRGSAGTRTNYNSVVMDGNISKLNALMSRYSERIYDEEVQRFVEHLVEELTKTKKEVRDHQQLNQRLSGRIVQALNDTKEAEKQNEHLREHQQDMHNILLLSNNGSQGMVSENERLSKQVKNLSEELVARVEENSALRNMLATAGVVLTDEVVFGPPEPRKDEAGASRGDELSLRSEIQDSVVARRRKRWFDEVENAQTPTEDENEAQGKKKRPTVSKQLRKVWLSIVR